MNWQAHQEPPHVGRVNPLRAGHRWGVALLALLYAVGLLALAGVTPEQVYASWPFHRLQTLALLDGHFHLSDSIYAVQFDTAVHAGKIQQVWGLGVGLWLVPFELLGRCFGLSPFPERVALGVALALFGYYCGITALRFGQLRKGFGFPMVMAYLLFFSPPLWTLMVKGPQSIYEDSSVYALVVSTAILVAVIRVTLFSTRLDFWICALLAALSGLIRPTHAIYGLAGVGLCFAILWLRRVGRPGLCAGLAVYVAGLAFLLISNQVRFGSPFEFGHRLTSTMVDGILTSRFVNPIHNASVWAASKELFGALFFSVGDIRDKPDFWAPIFPGQTSFLRWRNWYVTTFDPSLLLLILPGLGVTVVWLRQVWRRRPLARSLVDLPQSALVGSLGLWAVGTVLPLFGFMLYYPGLCARYLYDFWPAFAALLLLGAGYAVQHWERLTLGLLVVWLAFQMWRADCRLPMERQLTRTEAPARLEPLTEVSLESFHGQYDLEHHPSMYLFPRYQPFWNASTGLARCVVELPVDRPEFVELKVGQRWGSPDLPTCADTYRARLGPHELHLTSVIEDEDTGKITVRFEVPEAMQLRAEDHLLFLCFVTTGDRADWDSERMLHSIRWR